MQVLGEAYSTHDEEDMAVKEVTAISISQGRYAPYDHLHWVGANNRPSDDGPRRIESVGRVPRQLIRRFDLMAARAAVSRSESNGNGSLLLINTCK